MKKINMRKGNTIAEFVLGESKFETKLINRSLIINNSFTIEEFDNNKTEFENCYYEILNDFCDDGYEIEKLC